MSATATVVGSNPVDFLSDDAIMHVFLALRIKDLVAFKRTSARAGAVLARSLPWPLYQHQWRDRAAQLIRVAWRKKLRRTWLAVFDGPIVTHFTRAVVGDVFSVRDFARDDRPDLCRLVTRLSASCTEETSLNIPSNSFFELFWMYRSDGAILYNSAGDSDLWYMVCEEYLYDETGVVNYNYNPDRVVWATMRLCDSDSIDLTFELANPN